MSFSSRGRAIASLLNENNEIKETLQPDQVETSVYVSVDDLPVSGNDAGDQAFVSSTNNLYLWSGSGWYNIALINTSPYWSTQPASTYNLSNTGAQTNIEVLAVDSEGLPITYTVTTDSDFDTFATIIKDSDGGRRFTITLDSDVTTDNSGTVTFKASDGVNVTSFVSTVSVSFDAFISATGGTVTTSGDYKYHAFTSTGNTNFTVSSIGAGAGEEIEYLIVAGGGGGGYGGNMSGGGGGGGGVIHHTGWTGLTAQTYTITVGSGGTARNNGSNSSAFGNTALGGGKGGSDFSNGFEGGDGGSGGGSGVHSGGQDPGSASSQTTISGATAYGNAGGNNERSSPYYAGGGGGALSAGGAGTTTVAGNGGSGRQFNNFTSWGTDQNNGTSGTRGYFGGGGGAGAATLYGGTDIGTGGVGGGANGGTAGNGVSGIANTGGGGGGGNTSGGSGIVIIRYKYQ